jgi:hypothetical protein
MPPVETTDVIVIGASIAGASIAAEIAGGKPYRGGKQGSAIETRLPGRCHTSTALRKPHPR